MKIKEINLRESFGTKDVDVLIGDILVGGLVWDDLFEVYTFHTTHDLVKSFSYQKFYSTKYFLDNFGNMFSELLSTMSRNINLFKEDEVIFYKQLSPMYSRNDEFVVFNSKMRVRNGLYENCTVTKNFYTNTVTLKFENQKFEKWVESGFTTDEELINKCVLKNYKEIRWLNKISNGLIPIFYYIHDYDIIVETRKVDLVETYDLDKLKII